jgi:voltage-gated potassium channel
MELREKVFLQLHGSDGPGLTSTQRVIAFAIVSSVLLAILGTEPELGNETLEAIEAAELFLGALFVVEYVLRVWTCTSNPEYGGPGGRWRYVRRPVPLIDLLALLPFLVGAIGAESLILRIIRVLRLLALSKMLRYASAMRIVVGAVWDRRHELAFAMTLAGLMILVSSAALYIVEGGAQPKAFGSIVRAMWWSVVTLTTVGYGDVVPVTPLGKLFAAFTSIAGIGMIAMPTGILAASFSDGFARVRRQDERQYE